MEPAESAVDVLFLLAKCAIYGVAGIGGLFVLGTLSAYAAGCLISNSWNPFQRRPPRDAEQPRDPYL